MPYSLRGTCVVDASGQVVPGGCHPSRAAARRHLRALYANVPDVAMKAGNYGARAGQVISGNLVRGGDGKFSSGGKPSADKPVARGVTLSKPTPKRPPKPPKAPKRTRGRAGKRPKIAKPKKTDEQGRQERDDAKLRARQANRDAVKQRMAANDAGLGPAGFDALMAFSTGQPPSGAMADGLIKMGLAERANDGSVRMSAAGRATVNAANRGDYQAAIDAISKGTDQETGRRTRTEQRAARAAERERRRAEREAKRSRRTSSEGSSTPISGETLRGVIGQKSFSVFKDARGKLRWIARSTTAFRDRDGEIISTAALVKDADRMTRTRMFGPLRYWHAGDPDPDHPTAPWGPGVDLGMCDFSTVIGRTAVESGTFYDEAVGKAFAEAADQYELSPGFFHPYGSRGPADGVYEDIRRFERSPVPRAHARASNYFTGLMVKEQRMDPKEIARRVAVFKADMSARGVDATVIDQALAGVVQVEKAADAQHAAYKSAQTVTIYSLPDGTPGIIQDGAWVALKAAAPAPEPAPKAEEKAPEPEPMGDEPLADDGMVYVGDLSPDEFKALLAEAFAPMMGALNIETKMRGMLDEFKGALGGSYATKEESDKRVAEIATLKSQIETLGTRLALLEGDQPLVTVPAEIEAALKSSGPQAPPDPTQPQIPNDPGRPMAGIAAALMPELYRPWDGQQAPSVPQQPSDQPATWNGWPTAGGS